MTDKPKSYPDASLSGLHFVLDLPLEVVVERIRASLIDQERDTPRNYVHRRSLSRRRLRPGLFR